MDKLTTKSTKNMKRIDLFRVFRGHEKNLKWLSVYFKNSGLISIFSDTIHFQILNPVATDAPFSSATRKASFPVFWSNDI